MNATICNCVRKPEKKFRTSTGCKSVMRSNIFDQYFIYVRLLFEYTFQRQWLHSSVDRASHRYREVTGSSPVEVLNFFSREHMNPKLTCSQSQWLHSSVGRASHRYREVTGSSPVEVLNFFQASLRNCKNCDHNCEDHSSFEHFQLLLITFLQALTKYIDMESNWPVRTQNIHLTLGLTMAIQEFRTIEVNSIFASVVRNVHRSTIVWFIGVRWYI